VILYHFTTFAACQDILAEGFIRPARWKYGGAGWAPVVWLTADSDREHVFDTHPDDPAVVITTAIRFTVDLPAADVSQWREWTARHGRAVAADFAVEAAAYKPNWYVAERAVAAPEWACWDWVVDWDSYVEALSLAQRGGGRP
jgi:hypothetical protein